MSQVGCLQRRTCFDLLFDGTVRPRCAKGRTGFAGPPAAVVTRAALRIFPAPAERQVALCALSDFSKVRALLSLARQRLGGDLTAFEVMWSIYYTLIVERVPGINAPLAAGHPFYVLFEASGSDGERLPWSRGHVWLFRRCR